MSKRHAGHAGSWYSDNRDELDKQLTKWLQAVTPAGELLPACGVIAPHAGYSYSGPTAAYAYRHIDPSRVKRVFILGPSHHYHLTGCAVTRHKAYETPLGDLEIDAAVTAELFSTGEFETMSTEVDEEEHSIEMHLPYVYKAMAAARHSFTIVPVLVGSLTPEKERFYGQLFAQYLQDPANFFVISSDFCHWGERFRYTYYNPAHGEIHESIAQLDKKGMDIIETQNPDTFLQYQQQFQNTICGRHPIAVLLNSLKVLGLSRGPQKRAPYDLKFVRYAQSSPCKHQNDSSVSYASAVLRCEDK